MHELPDLSGLSVAEKDAVILALFEQVKQVERLTATVQALRKSTVGPVFGMIKHVMKFRQFLLRGLTGARGEWSLVCLAWNLKRMNALCA